ncbi:MAG: DUF2460 domain-containing protein [Acidobacteriota bacterium]|nr:DUF2460 domain-containing protein [Acidobacteriota bacterium]
MASNFDYVLFPLSVSDFVGTVEYLTTVIPRGNGGEQRIARWADGRAKFDAALGVRSLKDLQTLVKFHCRRKGKERGFMVRNLLDYTIDGSTSGEGAFGLGDTSTKTFQLTKTTTDYTTTDPVYGTTGNTETRNIYLPEHGTVTVYVNGVAKVEGIDYTIDYKTGKVTFTSAPALNALLEWTGRFYIPVRFTEDEVPADAFLAVMKLDSATNQYVLDKAVGPIPNVGMIEVRDLAS